VVLLQITYSSAAASSAAANTNVAIKSAGPQFPATMAMPSVSR